MDQVHDSVQKSTPTQAHIRILSRAYNHTVEPSLAFDPWFTQITKAATLHTLHSGALGTNERILLPIAPGILGLIKSDCPTPSASSTTTSTGGNSLREPSGRRWRSISICVAMRRASMSPALPCLALTDRTISGSSTYMSKSIRANGLGHTVTVTEYASSLSCSAVHHAKRTMLRLPLASERLRQHVCTQDGRHGI
jgi:hypothetical protein